MTTKNFISAEDFQNLHRHMVRIVDAGNDCKNNIKGNRAQKRAALKQERRKKSGKYRK